MAVTYQAAGTRAVGAGDVAPGWPTHVINDIGILICETANQAVSENTAGWTQITGSPQGTGTEGAAAATRLTAWWKRAASAAEAAANITGVTDHKNAQIFTIRGASTTADVSDVVNAGVDSTSDNDLNAVGPTSTFDESLVVCIATTDTDAATARWSSEANTNLASVAERIDQSDTTGNGGGLMVTTGYLDVAGPTGTFTGTAATNTKTAWMVVVLSPQLGVTQPAGPGTTIYLYDNASALDGIAFQSLEISSAFPADFIQHTSPNEYYQAKVDVQIGDNGTGTKATAPLLPMERLSVAPVPSSSSVLSHTPEPRPASLKARDPDDTSMWLAATFRLPRNSVEVPNRIALPPDVMYGNDPENVPML